MNIERLLGIAISVALLLLLVVLIVVLLGGDINIDFNSRH